MNRLLAYARGLWWRPLATIVTVIVVGSVPWWAPRALAALSFFRLRRVEVLGARFVAPGELVRLLGVDTSTSVWTDTRELERRVASHPQVRSVEIDRVMPGSLVLRVTEHIPVAFIPSSQGMRAVDARGRVLPIDPSRVRVDLPIVPRADTMLLRVLDEIRIRAPALYERISELRRSGRDEIVLRLTSVRVLATTSLTAARLAEILPVERDLARRSARVTELDLRYRDQVIARVK